MEAVKWVLDTANQVNYVRGIKIGYHFYDTCSIPHRAMHSTLGLMNRSEKDGYLAGIIGPATSSQAKPVAYYLRDSSIPLVSYSATLTKLNNRRLFPNFFRTAIPDSVQTKVIVDLIQSLKWIYVMIIHTDDNYGIDGASGIIKQLKSTDVCTEAVFQLPTAVSTDDRSLRNVMVNMSDTLQGKSNGHLGVVFFGQAQTARTLLRYISTQLASDPNGRYWLNVTWVMSDAIEEETFTSDYVNDKLTKNVIVVSPAFTVLDSFKQHWQNKVTNITCHRQNVSRDDVWIQEFFLSHPCGVLPYKQSVYLERAVDATLFMLHGIKDMQKRTCGVISEVCPEMKKSLLNMGGEGIFSYLINGTATVTSNIMEILRPQIGKYLLTLNTDTGVISSNRKDSPNYVISRFYNPDIFTNIGHYVDGINLTGIGFTQPSKCIKFCQACKTRKSSPLFAYIPGKSLILSFFSLHASSSRFLCKDNSRINHLMFEALEAFRFSILKLQNQSHDIGGLVFDDCSNELITADILLSFFKEKLELYDPLNSAVRIKPDNVIAVMEGSSQAISDQLVILLAKLQIPLVGYGSRPDDSNKYPYYLDTVSSNDPRSKVISKLIYVLNWNHVSVLYSVMHGQAGADSLVSYFDESGICNATFHEIPFGCDYTKRDWLTLIRQISGSNVVVLWLEQCLVREFLYLLDNGMSGGGKVKYNIIIPDKVSFSAVRVQSIGFMFMLQHNQYHYPKDEFQSYLQTLRPAAINRNPWLSELWQEHFQCFLGNRIIDNYTRECSSLQNGSVPVQGQDGYAPKVYRSTYAIAAALKKTLQSCSLEISRCLRKNIDTFVEHIREECITQDDGSCVKLNGEDGNGNQQISVLNSYKVGSTIRHEKIGIYQDEIGKLKVLENTVRPYTSDTSQRPITKSCALNCRHRCSNDSIPPLAITSPVNPVTIILIAISVTCLLIIKFLVYWIHYNKGKNNRNDKPIIAAPITATEEHPYDYPIIVPGDLRPPEHRNEDHQYSVYSGTSTVYDNPIPLVFENSDQWSV